MSVQRFHRIICDGCGRIGTGLMPNSGEGRKITRKLGWRHTTRRSYEAGGSPTRDDCPCCVNGTSPAHTWARRLPTHPWRCATCYQPRTPITAAQRCPGTSHREIVGKDWPAEKG